MKNTAIVVTTAIIATAGMTTVTAIAIVGMTTLDFPHGNRT